MKTRKFSDEEISNILDEAKKGAKVRDLCRKHGISQATFYKWRSKYDCMTPFLIAEVRIMKAESRQLRMMNADLSMQNELIKEAFEKISVSLAYHTFRISESCHRYAPY